MVSQPQAGRGRTVYSGGSFAPTRGAVSGAGVRGYLQRSVNNANKQGPWGGASKWGNDGQSDTRSGVAQRAMQRRSGMGGWNNQWAPGGHGSAGGYSGGTQQGANKPPGAGVQSGGDLANSDAPPGAPAPSVATPTVVVGDAGKLELPYDPAYGQDVYDALKGSNDELAGVQQQEQAQGALYANQQYLQGQQFAGQQVKTLNHGGASGNLFSSGQGMAVANDYNQNQNALNQYANENTQAMSGFATQKTGIQNAFRQFLSNRTLQYGDDLSEDAGSLGFGASEPAANDMGDTMPKKPGRPGSWNSQWKSHQTNHPKPPKKKTPPKKTPPHVPGQTPGTHPNTGGMK